MGHDDASSLFGWLIVSERSPTLADKVAFLGRPATFGVQSVACRETHMSYVFLAGDRVYKLKKPVWFPYLNFCTVDRREAACRAELRLNRRLAADVYLDVVPLTWSERGLALDGDGTVVDWLVVMRRLNEHETLEYLIVTGQLENRQAAAVASILVEFYRHATPILISPDAHLADWRTSLSYNYRVLIDARFGLPAGLVTMIDRTQRRFLRRHAEMLRQRVHDRRILDGHGDLRPEHVWIADRVRIIDSLEFSQRLRANDPFDEMAFLDMECERLGARWAGAAIRRRVAHGLGDGVADALFTFYRCHRATLRARLAIAHMLEPQPRSPEKWPALCRTYLSIAAADARKLERYLNRPGDRRGRGWQPSGGCPRQTAELRTGRAPSAVTYPTLAPTAGRCR